MDIQRVRVKMFARAPSDLDVAPILDIFSRWRTDTAHPAEWIDLADYAHVPDGPLALLVGKQGNLGYDCEDGRPGLIWRNKIDLAGDPTARVLTALRRGVTLFAALQKDGEFPGAIELDVSSLAIEFVDRVAVPNDEASDRTLGPAVRAALDRLYGTGGYEVARQDDSGRPYGFEAQATDASSLSQLLGRLGGDAANSSASEERPMQVTRISATTAQEWMEHDDYLYVDVRSSTEFQAGHPTGAYNIPVLIEGPAGGLVPNADFLGVFTANFETDAKIVVGCRSGGRSLRAAQILTEAGYKQIVDNYAGFDAGSGPDGQVEAGWARAGLPVSEAPVAGRDYESLKAKP